MPSSWGATEKAGDAPVCRVRVSVSGVVQGIGFRPRLHRIATRLGLGGWVRNTREGVIVEVGGPGPGVDRFLQRLREELPAGTIGVSTCPIDGPGTGDTCFEIRDSDTDGDGPAAPPPDVAPCAECVRELLDPDNRRYRYPFITCARCGPRFTLLESMPYDRERTVLRAFPLCAACEREYSDPEDRRFHAQAIACPDCGPQLQWWDASGVIQATRDAAIQAACDQICGGGIVAVKGVGGFQLMVDATSPAAVQRLRERKARPAKPVAVMFRDLEMAREFSGLTPDEEALLASPEAPIVLVNGRSRPSGGTTLAAEVACGLPWVGAMLPSSPLHHLLLRDLGVPVVATSGNRSEEPICFREAEVVERLGGLADGFLVHDRPIVRPVDDSVVQWVAGRRQIMRRARGWVPLPVELPLGRGGIPVPVVLGMGTHQKNAVALGVGERVWLSAHLGDMDTVAARQGLERTVDDLGAVLGATPTVAVVDRHPDYYPTQQAIRSFSSGTSGGVVSVSHHAAHVLSCMAEQGLNGPVLGVAWDGTGLGPDGTLWGGEFLKVGESGVVRIAHWRPFPLPGGERGVEEPRRAALGLLWELLGADAVEVLPDDVRRSFEPAELRVLLHSLERGVCCPRTSSVGRLFDAVASLTGLRQRSRFEGDAAMALEAACMDLHSGEQYDATMNGNLLDWAPLVWQVLEDIRSGVPRGRVALRFHNTLAAAVVTVANGCGLGRVVLSGGCFQNRRLTETVVKRLRETGFTPYWQERVPPNDGGIALGQVFAHRLGLAGKV